MKKKDKQKTILNMNKELIEALLNNVYTGIHIINKDGIIVFRNKKVEEITDIKSKDLLNHHFSVIYGKGELLDVLRTGIPQFGTSFKAKTGDYLVNRIPLISNNSIIGAMSIGFFEDTIIPPKYNLMQQKLEYYEKELRNMRSAKYDLNNIIGESDNIRNIKNLIIKYGEIDAPVLIAGNTGTGKELCAHAIHLNSKRKNAPFIKVNCAAIPHDLFESELFGYEPGAFTGADKHGKIGKFELANHGTFFLDEISSLPLEMQPKLLRVLQDGEIEKIGGNKVVKLDLRVISTTNRNLAKLVEENKFREDLYYRIKVLYLSLSPLVERKNDIPLISEYFIKLLNKESNLGITGISEEVMETLCEWRWPGNVRELKNVVETAANLNETGAIEIKDLPDYLAYMKSTRNIFEDIQPINHLKEAKNNFERKLLESALTNFNWNKSRAAKELGVSRPLLYALIRKYGLDLKGTKNVRGRT
jgi:transcriptional regulator with PAS, ATPase and Fis domain